MVSVVGSKGQIVITKQIRDQLGIVPGCRVSQRLVDDHVEIYFMSPEHNRSLKGILRQYINPSSEREDDWADVRERAWVETARERGNCQAG